VASDINVRQGTPYNGIVSASYSMTTFPATNQWVSVGCTGSFTNTSFTAVSGLLSTPSVGSTTLTVQAPPKRSTSVKLSSALLS